MSDFFKIHYLANSVLVPPPYTGQYVPAALSRNSTLFYMATGVSGVSTVNLQVDNPFFSGPAKGITFLTQNVTVGSLISGGMIVSGFNFPLPNTRVMISGQSGVGGWFSVALFQQN